MPEFENKEDKSTSENAKALKHMIKSKMRSVKEEKWKNKALHGECPKIPEEPHVDTVTTNKWLSENLKGETESGKWKAIVECAHNMKRQWTISFLDVRY